MASIDVPLKKGGFGTTSRKDNWWVEPLVVFLSYAAFIIYSNIAVFQASNFHYVLPIPDYLKNN